VKGSATVGGPNGHRSNGSEIEGRPDPQLKAGVPDRVPNGVARRGARRVQTECPTGPDGVARWGVRRGRTRCPAGWADGVGRRGGQTGCPTGPNGVPDGARRDAQQGRTRCAKGGQTWWPDGMPDGARRVPRHFLNATSSATSFLNAMSPV
jgi:hypothetical protein